MVILFLLFLVQFAVACACLALSSDQQRRILRLGWSRASNELKYKMQHEFTCCGFDNDSVNLPPNDLDNMGHPPCEEVRFFLRPPPVKAKDVVCNLVVMSVLSLCSSSSSYSFIST